MPLEKALEGDLTICDPHHHLFPPGSPIHATYLVEDLRRDINSGHRVVSTVYIETGSAYRTERPVHLQPVGETSWVVSQANNDGLMRGIVGYANLMLGHGAEEILAAHIDEGAGRFRGVRYRRNVKGQPEPPTDWLTNPQLHGGVKALERLGLMLEMYISHSELFALAELARTFPNLPIVLDHLGLGRPSHPQLGQGNRADMLALWRSELELVAACENVSLKIGGLGMPFMTDRTIFPSPPSSVEVSTYWRPEMEFVIELFGSARCMFESNFPMDRGLYDYVTLWNVFKRLTKDMSPSERAAMFHDNAVRLYRLN
jgi:L-fuconolactonase